MTSSLSTITYHWARRIAIAVVGGTVLLVGVALTVLPGPAFIVIPAGLGILSLEFAWARRWLRKVRNAADGIVNSVRSEGDEAPRETDTQSSSPPAGGKSS